ncbi:MAG: glycosyltransferase family 4 protein [Chloroflexota bacterium]|nr:glycosyltransferase family 4 protein [Chloroflexota bacterium]
MVSAAGLMPMQVLHVIKATGIAGAEKHLLQMLPGLRTRGIDARLLLLQEAARPQDEFARLLREQNVPVEQHTMQRHVDAALLPWLTGYLRSHKPDIVHTHLLHAVLYGTLAARAIGARTMSSHHNDDPFLRRLPLRISYRQLWRMMDAGIAISEHVAAFCREMEGAPADKLHVIHYGLPAPPPGHDSSARMALRRELGLSKDALLVGMIARLIKQKGVSYGLQAFARVSERYPDAHLIIVGDGDLRAALEAEARALRLSPWTHFLGWRADAAALMRGLDVLLMPSLWEGFGLVLLEAMAASLPVVASDISAIPEIVVHGETGLLVAPADIDGLAAALDRLLRDTPLRQHMGLLGLDRLEAHFSVEQMIDKTVAVYASVNERHLRS